MLLPVILWIPGRLLLAAAGRAHAPAWLAVPVSYGLWVGCWSGAALVAAPRALFEIAWLALVVVLAALAWRRRGPQWPSLSVQPVAIALFTGLALYLAWVGPYLEVPADAWWHLGEVRAVLDQADTAAARLDRAWIGQEQAWFYLYAQLCRWSGLALEDSPAWMAFAGGLALLWCYYGFATWVFSRARLAQANVPVLAAIATLLFLAHFGVSVFSWLRYYSLAPALLNFAVFLAVVALVVQALEGARGWAGDLALAALLVAAAAVVHRQEAVFALVMGFTLLVVSGLRDLDRGGRRPPARIGLAALALAAYVVVHLLAREYLPRNAPELEVGWLTRFPFLDDAFVALPSGHTWHALTAWGVAVYLVFAWRWRRFLASPYLLAGMLVPIFTLFNPLFVDLFLHFSYPEVLWRFVYLVPLPLVAAVLLSDGLRAALGTGRWPARLGGAAVSAALLVLLAPWHTPFGDLRYSRLVTLGPVDVTNSARLWDDLYAELRRRPAVRVLTDPVTGYTLAALTSHRYHGYKFYVTPQYPLLAKRYARDDFGHLDGKLLVVNRRNGRGSRAGRLSGHWPADIMRVSRFYSPEFLEFVQSNPAMFRKTWERDRIAIYEINTREPGAGA